MTDEIAQQIQHLNEIVHQFNIQQSDDNPEITKQYGYLKFDANDVDATTRLSQYIRLALQTDARTVVKFLQYGWCLPMPDLIISVTGGGRRCKMSTHLRKIFQRGLVVAAATTNAWLITAGNNTGVVKEVGEALSNYRYKSHKHGLDVPCIGICTWEYTASSEQLEYSINEPLIISNNNNVMKRHSRLDSIHDWSEENYIRSYVVKQAETKRCDLEPNHTHFLIFDGESSNIDSVLLQRANIEKYARQIDRKTSTEDALIPIVMILLEGAPFSIRTACRALQSNTPLVVVKGSGRAADLVADLYMSFSQTGVDECQVETQFTTHIDDHSCMHFKNNALNEIFERSLANSNTWVDEVKSDLCQILCRRKQLVVIFEFDSPRHHGNLEDAILEALLKAAKFSGDNTDEQQCRVAEMKLSMAWKKIDYARKHILTDKTILKWAEIDLCHALVDALRRNYIDFVELLMDYGTSLDKLTLNDLEQLYTSSDTDDALPVDKKSREDLPTRNDYYSFYFPGRSHPNQIILDKNAPLGSSAAREFFLWAIFLDRLELAKYLCSKTWNQTVAPLVAARIYRLAATYALHSETKQRYENNALQFDRYAMSIIDQCFDNDEVFGLDLLKQPAIAFDNVDPLKLAEKTRCRTFLASNCVQKNVHQKWFGHINYKGRAINLRIFLCTLFIPLLPIFAIFLPYLPENRSIIQNKQSSSIQRRRSSVVIRKDLRSDRNLTNNHIRWSQKIIYFYQAPIVRFCYHVIFFVLFLGLFSYVLLMDFLPLNIYYAENRSVKKLLLPITEIILHVCMWSLIIEELREFVQKESQEYFSNLWNLIDITAIILYLIAFVTRFIMKETFFMISKIFLCLDLIIWFVGTLQLFAAFERLGPKLVMIFNTMKDLFFFVCFILIFLCGFSITSWSLITTTSQLKWIYNDDGQLLNVTVTFNKNDSWTWQRLRDITHYGVWKIFGQVDLINGTDSYSNIAFVLAIVFVAFANILLLNVLIALFNVTIQNVQEQSHDLWRYQRFLIVNEFRRKPPIPPPFNIIYYLFVFIHFLITRLQIYRKKRRFIASEMLLDDIKTVNNNIQQTQQQQQQFKISDAMRRERAIAEDYWRDVFQHNIDDRMKLALQNIEHKIDQLPSRLQDNNKHTVIHQELNNQMKLESDV